MERLHKKGFISDPVGKAKSVVLTEEGLREAVRAGGSFLLRQAFAASDREGAAHISTVQRRARS
jgi:hypothetical protein